MISSLTDIKTPLQALNVGALGFLQKPFSSDSLVDTLQELMPD